MIYKPVNLKIRSAIRFTLVSMSVLLFAGFVPANVEKPFLATFHGFALPPTPTDIADTVEIIVPLKGNATHLGKFDELLVHELNVKTLAFTGHTEWTVANGDKLYTTFSGQAYPTDDPAWITFDVTHTITGGTGRFQGATGTLEGVNGRFNLVTGEDVGGYVGTISY